MNLRAELRVLINRQEIEAAVRRLASEISEDYRNKNPVLLGILRGSFVFLADLIRHLDFPLEVDFIGLSSYGSSTQTSGKIKVVKKLETPVRDRNVLIVEDIADTGLTTDFLIKYLKRQKPASLKLCTLTDKPSRREVPVHIDYIGFTVPNKFLVGYGLDANQKFRNLPDICYFEGEAQ
ncbi:MAG: hypoxanthine phosphoribosyltransferase [Dehalococcoidales bacterium]|nr:hypoxanthine phosphoribosyltransferase [Dehalococcoidales bacterium]